MNRIEIEQQIRDYISEGISVSLYGERNIGKTTLVKKICREYSGIYLDLQLIRSEQEFKEYLAQELDINPLFKWFRLQRIIEKKRLLCLDEFENILNFDSKKRYFLLSALRASQQAGVFQFIVVSHRSLDLIIPESEYLTSPFYNVLMPCKFR